MTSYYPMEQVRDLLLAAKYEVASSIDKPVPMPSWNKYPCKKLEGDNR